MSDVREDLIPWFDEFGFMGRSNHARAGEEGNPETETGLAFLFLKLWGKLDAAKDAKSFDEVMDRVTTSHKGCYNKKILPDGIVPNDEITHDDLIGICLASTVLATYHRFELCHYGMTHGWNLSNTGKWYYTGIAKPWHIAFYMFCANEEPTLWDTISLFVSIVANAYTQMDDAGGKRLTYMITQCLDGKDPLIDIGIFLWRRRVKTYYGSFKRIMTMYYNNPDHIFVRLWPE